MAPAESAPRCTALSGAPAHYPAGVLDLGGGVRAWLQPNGSWGETNAGLITSDDQSVLVDTLWDARLAEGMLAGFAAPLRAAPIGRVVNTHRDGDHWWGNVTVPSTARIVASEAAAAEMASEPPPAALDRLARLSRLGASLPGPVGRVSAYSRDMLSPFAHHGLPVRRPDETFSGERVLEVGELTVHLLEVGPAHTAGDVVVHVPEAGVVFCGDILFRDVTPVMWHGPLAGWVAALDRCLALDVDRFVPGHGPIATRADVTALRDYWTWVRDAGGAEHQAGRAPLAASRRLVRTDGFGRWRSWLVPERLVLNLVTYFRELDGQPPLPPTAGNRLRLFRMVADLAANLSD